MKGSATGRPDSHIPPNPSMTTTQSDSSNNSVTSFRFDSNISNVEDLGINDLKTPSNAYATNNSMSMAQNTDGPQEFGFNPTSQLEKTTDVLRRDHADLAVLSVRLINHTLQALQSDRLPEYDHKTFIALRSDRQPEYDQYAHHLKMRGYRNKIHHDGSFNDTVQALKHDRNRLYKELIHASVIPYINGTNGALEPEPMRENPVALRNSNQLPFSLISSEAVAVHFDFDEVEQLLLAWKSIDTHLIGYGPTELFEEAKIMVVVETHVLKEIKLLLDHRLETRNSIFGPASQTIEDQIIILKSLEETILGMASMTLDMPHPGMTPDADTVRNTRYFQTFGAQVKWLVDNGSISTVHDVIGRQVYFDYFGLQQKNRQHPGCTG